MHEYLEQVLHEHLVTNGCMGITKDCCCVSFTHAYGFDGLLAAS